MEFGSNFVYRYDDSEEEVVSDEEYESVMDISSNPLSKAGKQETDGEASSSASSAGVPDAGRQQKEKKLHKWMVSEAVKSKEVKGPSSDVGAAEAPAAVDGRKWRRADTNIVVVKFDQLTKPSNMHTGDAVSCKQCRAMLSHISKITEQGEDKTWRCEFCNESNVVDILPGEIPTQPDITYMVKPSPLTSATSCQGVEDSVVIFCIDISGSMSQGVGNKSRLECVKAAIVQQLRDLVNDHPTRKVALVTFESEVCIVGDGKIESVTITKNLQLNSFDELVRIGSEFAEPGDISTTYDFLKQKVTSLSSRGSTALGPALLVSVMMAAKRIASKVIICTDGEANQGLGSLDRGNYDAASIFYQQLGEKARSLGVSVSVLTVAGTECKLVELGEVAMASGGQVNIVDPRKLSEEFGSIFVETVIACRVEATFLVHKGLYIRGESQMTSSVKRDVGNVTNDTEITFEFGIRTAFNWKGCDGAAAAAAAAGDDAAGNELPFQVQIKYTDLDGAEAVRVLTRVQPVTTDRREAENAINVPVVTSHVAKQSAAFALKGDYGPSRLNTFMAHRLVARNSDDAGYGAHISVVAPLHNDVLRKQQEEARYTRGTTVSTYEAFYDDDEDQKMGAGYGSKLAQHYHKKKGALAMNQRRANQTDFSSHMYHHMASKGSRPLTKK